MSGSRRFLLLLLLACVTCVVLVQVTLDGWNVRTSFSYGMHPEPKGNYPRYVLQMIILFLSFCET